FERELFEHLSLDLVQQCEDTSNIVLDKARLRWSDLVDVLLVGGSTRMPMYRQLFFRLTCMELAETVNPLELVALGAALAGVCRHRPEHPALQFKRRAMQDRARELEEEESRGGVELPGEPTETPAPAAAAGGGQRAAAIGLAYGGHVAEKALRERGANAPNTFPPDSQDEADEQETTRDYSPLAQAADR